MKTKLSIISAAMATLMLASCQNDEFIQPEQPQSETVTLISVGIHTI